MSCRGMTWNDGNRGVWWWVTVDGEIGWEESRARHVLRRLVVVDEVRWAIGSDPWSDWVIYGARLQSWSSRLSSMLWPPAPRWWRRLLMAAVRRIA